MVVVKKEVVLNQCGGCCADLRTGRTVNMPVICQRRYKEVEG